MFIDSNITKWKLPPWTDDERKDLNKVVLDKIPTHYQHRPSCGGRQRHGASLWQMAGRDEQAFRRPPRQRRSIAAGISQLIDITGAK